MITLSYSISKAAQDAEYIRTGVRSLFRTRKIEVDETQLTPEQRALLVQFNPSFGSKYGEPAVYRFVAAVGIFPPVCRKTTVEFDHDITIDEWFEHQSRMLLEQASVEQQIADAMPAYEAERIERLRHAEELKLAEREARLEKQRQAQEERKQRAVIDWKDGNTAIVNLYDAVFAASGLEGDTRFTSWVKQIVSIDKTKQNGYCYEGDFIPCQTVEITRSRRIYLVAATTGSRRNQTTEYTVVEMDADGILRHHDITTDNSDAGWALRIRDQIAELLK